MVRVLAFVSGVTVGVALLLFVVGGLPFCTTAAPAGARSITIDVQQGAGPSFVHPTDPQGLPSLGEDDPDDGSQVDLQGDEVTPAVATYRFDAHGNIYETHAPHTEVPHLGSPTL